MSANSRLVELEQELARRESGHIPMVENQGPQQARLQELEQELGAREAQSIAHGELEPKEWQKALKGFVATGPAGIVDLLRIPLQTLANKADSEAGQASMLGTLPERARWAKQFMAEHWPRPLSEVAGEKFHEVTGFPAPPSGEEPGISQLMGEIASPMPGELIKGVTQAPALIAKGVKAIPSVAKKLGTRLAESLGAATGIKELPNISEEGSLPETIGKAVIGSTVARGATHLPKLIPTQKNLARAVSLGAKPNEALFNLAEKQGIELPINVGMDSRPLNFATNYASKTMFSSQDFRESIKRADKSVLKSVTEKLDTLGEKNIPPSEASQQFKDFLSKQEKEVNEVVSKQYDKARESLKPTDSVVPAHTIKTVQAMKDILESPVKDKSTKAVAKVVLDLADSWGMTPKDVSKQIRMGKGQEVVENPKIIEMVLKQMEKSSHRAIPLAELDIVRSQIGKILGHKQEVYGMEKWLKGLQNSIAKDLETSTNKEYVSSLRKAHDFYRESYASRFREDLAQSILEGKEPLYTYSQLNDTHALKTLEKIAGESHGAKGIVDSLKKAKLREMLNNAITPEGVKTGNFARMFDKNEVGQEFLKELLGTEAYNGMKDIASIMREQQAAGREVLNTSGTAYTQSDLKTLGKFGSAAAGAITALFATNPTLGAAGLGSAATTIGATNYLSRLMADPVFVKQARAFAIARKNNNLKYSDQLLNQMGRTASRVITIPRSNEGKEDHE